jgi:hypothetical protein
MDQAVSGRAVHVRDRGGFERAFAIARVIAGDHRTVAVAAGNVGGHVIDAVSLTAW